MTDPGSTAQFVVLPETLPILVGLTLYHAFMSIDASVTTVTMVSNAMPVELAF